MWTSRPARVSVLVFVFFGCAAGVLWFVNRNLDVSDPMTVVMLSCGGVAVLAAVGALVSAIPRRIRPEDAGEVTVRRSGTAGPVTLGVKSAIGQNARGLPQYVGRDVDERIAEAMAAGGPVLLRGPAAAGKTRVAFHALSQVDRKWRVLAPQPGTDLALLPRSHTPWRRTVVWLDDLERFIHTSRVPDDLLARLCPPGRDDLVVLATIREAEHKAIFGEPPNTIGDERRQIVRPGAALLQTWPADRQFVIDTRLSETELARAKEIAATDERIRAATAAPAGFGSHLIAGPAMLDHWRAGRDRDPVVDLASAAISAAVDIRRAGYHVPVPVEALRELAQEFVTPARQDGDELPPFEDALEYATRELVSGNACLFSRPAPDGGTGYLAHDFLFDRAGSPESLLAEVPVNPATWNIVARLVSTADQHLTVGLAAYRHNAREVAEPAWHHAAAGGDTDALVYLGLLLDDRGDSAGAQIWYRRAADAGNTDAMLNLGNLLVAREDAAGAEAWYRKAADAGNVGAMNNLGLLMRQSGHIADAERWYRKAIDAGNVGAMYNLGLLFAARGEPAEAAHWYRRAGEAGNLDAMYNLGLLLDDHGDTGEAERWYRRAAESGHGLAMVALAFALADRGDAADAEQWYRKAIDAGEPEAMRSLAVLLRNRGDIAEADLWQRAWQMRTEGVTIAET